MRDSEALNTLDWLQLWYESQCNGDWEHRRGIRIGTIDNPGWSIWINLEDTDLEDVSFDRVDIERSDDDWLTCWVEENVFETACGPYNLTEALNVFREWVQQQNESQ